MSYYYSEKEPGDFEVFDKIFGKTGDNLFSNSGTYKKMVGAQVIFDRNVVEMVIMPLNL